MYYISTGTSIDIYLSNHNIGNIHLNKDILAIIKNGHNKITIKTEHQYKYDTRHIKLCCELNCSLSYIPITIQTIDIKCDYKYTLDYLPLKLKYLNIGLNNIIYKKTIDKLPYNMEYLIISDKFNHYINNLPPLLNDLTFTFYSIFNKYIFCLPNTLKKLILPIQYDIYIGNQLYIRFPNISIIRIN